MPPKPKAQTPVGASVHREREVLPSSDLVMGMFSDPLPCIVLDPESDRRFGGTLYRDTYWGPSVRIAENWVPGQTMAPVRIRPGAIFGRTADRVHFTLKDPEIESWPHSTEINAGVMLTGTWLPKEQWRFNNITVAIDAFADFLYGVDLDDKGGAVEVGAATVRPKRFGSHRRGGLESTIPALEIVTPQRHTLDWWLDQWVNPLIRLVAIGTGFPCTATAITTDGARFCGPQGEEEEPWHFVGAHWPTLQLAAHREPIAAALRLEPLFSWSSPDFDIAKAITGIRRLHNRFSFVSEHYTEMIRSERNWRDRFLQMVQCIESIDAGTGDRTDPEKVKAAKELLARLQMKDVTGADLRSVKTALANPAALEPPLWKRIRSVCDVPGLPNQPTKPPPWGTPGTTWPQWIAQARNKISHGNPVSTERDFREWAMRQTPYLQCVVEVWLMQQFGFPLLAATQSSVDRYRQAVGYRWRGD